MLEKSYEEENISQALIEIERKDEVFFSIINMDDHIPYGSENKIPYSSIDWVDRDTFGMKTLGGEAFYLCNNFFVGTIIVLTYEHQQRLILQLLYTSHTHAHEVHSNFHVLEEFEVKQDEDQALTWFLRDYELPLGKYYIISEEAHDHTVTDPTNG